MWTRDTARIVAGVWLLSSACRQDWPRPPRVEVFSFEAGLDGWNPQAFDHVIQTPSGPEEIPWHITPSRARASDGAQSLEFDFHNRTDAAKIWVERSFTLEPNTDYDGTIVFDWRGEPGAQGNLFVAAGPTPLRTRDAIVAAVVTSGVRVGPFGSWATYAVNRGFRTDATGQCVVAVGAWGTFEIQFTGYLDQVRILFAPVSDATGRRQSHPAGPRLP